MAITHPQIHSATLNRMAKVELQIFLMESAMDVGPKEGARVRKDDSEDKKTRGPGSGGH
jgi:hypothetical protein